MLAGLGYTAIGYCFGGSVALTMANSEVDLDTVAAFHSGLRLPITPNDKLKAQVLVCNGADDNFVSPKSVEAFKSVMDSIGANTSIFHILIQNMVLPLKKQMLMLKNLIYH